MPPEWASRRCHTGLWRVLNARVWLSLKPWVRDYGAGCTPPCAMASSVSRLRKRLFALRGTTRATIFRLCGARSDPTAMDPQRSQNHCSPNKEARPVRLLLPDGKVHQQPCRHMHVVHDPQRTGVYLRSAVVPHEVTQPRCHHAQPDQNAPLQGCRRELLRVAEHKPCRHRDDSCPHIEPGERVMLWHRAGFHQALVPDHTDGKAEVRQLHEHQPGPEVVAHFVVANNRRPDHRQRRAQQISPAQTTFAEQIVNQRDIERRKHGEKQKFRDRQVDVSPEAEQVHDAELHRPHQHVQQNGLQRLPACTQEGQEYQRRQPHAHQHREVAVDVPGEVLAN
ncbi:hypothetical protein EcWSU1_04353 [Enterobacter ludwigii]|uniref:Uncharacterized protein n=1 Tax=Enterobacter ludwigii TaxID=299767 RepID=G8LK48_9ENTR|nr:hypothetical protein EcWSU1_04353 [Enterobacter ludwigii]